jgi:uncharacterized membrane protein
LQPFLFLFYLLLFYLLCTLLKISKNSKKYVSLFFLKISKKYKNKHVGFIFSYIIKNSKNMSLWFLHCTGRYVGAGSNNRQAH